MKKIFSLLLFAVCFCNCNQKKKIEFITLNDSEFNSKPFALFKGKIPDSKKKSLDSCMGFSFDANALFVQTKDTFFVGSIINRQSLKIVNSLTNIGFKQNEMLSKFNILANSCYEKQTLHISLKSLSGEKFTLQLPGATKAINDELNNDIANAQNTEMRTGQWIYLDFKQGLSDIFDTASSASGLNYKKDLLNPDNMVLIANESITNISFIINTEKDISEELLPLLQQKPYAVSQNTYLSIQLFYIDSKTFQMDVNGFFPVAGQFVKAELK